MVRAAEEVGLNAKITKELRRYAREMRDPQRPIHKLLGRPVKLRNGETAYIAKNHSASERGIYLALKAAVEKDPTFLQQLRDQSAYRKMIEHEKESGGPLYAPS